MARACRLTLVGLGVLYALAFALFLVGTYGWFGSPQGSLAGVFLMPLGLPWTLWFDLLPSSAARPSAAVLAPALNLLLLWGLCRWWARRRAAA